MRGLAPATLVAACLFASSGAQAKPDASGEIDLLELRVGDDAEQIVYESAWSYGDETEAAVLKLDGGGQLQLHEHELQVQLLYSRSLSSTVTVLGGVRRDVNVGPDLSHAALGMELELPGGLAAEHYLYLSDDGDLTGAAEIVTQVPLGGTIALEPRVSLSWAAQPIAQQQIASGFTDLSAAIRVRTAVSEHFGAYVGLIHERLLAGTASAARSGGESTSNTAGVVGVSFAF